jgi:hypothetical protein
MGSLYLCTILGIDNVTVNYIQAALPYTDLAEKIASSVRQTKKSICIGTSRILVEYKDEKLLFPGLDNCFGTTKTSLSVKQKSFCVGPINIPINPRGEWVNSFTSTVESYISNVLSEDSLRMLKWTIGNGLIDPVDQPRILYFYSNGGHGKSTLIELLNQVLKGSMEPLSKDYLSTESEISMFDIQNLVDCRFTSIGDASMKTGKVNESFWKMVTGGDSIATSIGVVASKSTLFVGSNDLWYPNSRIHNKWFTRRGCVISLKKEIDNKFVGHPMGAKDDNERLRFIMSCVKTRFMFKNPPITAKQALMTVFGRAAKKSTRGVFFRDNVDYITGLQASVSISIAGDIDLDLLLDLVGSMSSDLILRQGTGRSMAGITIEPEVYKLNTENFIDEYNNVDKYIAPLQKKAVKLWRKRNDQDYSGSSSGDESL